jgi:hypothetical protein
MAGGMMPFGLSIGQFYTILEQEVETFTKIRHILSVSYFTGALFPPPDKDGEFVEYTVSILFIVSCCKKATLHTYLVINGDYSVNSD